MRMKNLWIYLIGGILAVITTIWWVTASAIANAGKEFPLWDGTAAENNGSAIDMGKLVKEDAIDPKTSASERIQNVLGVDYADAENQRATYYIQRLINRFLAIIGLIALGVMVYGFYKMFVAKDNAAAFQDALKIVKWAAIALIAIGVSWYVVSILFDVFFAAKEDIQ